MVLLYPSDVLLSSLARVGVSPIKPNTALHVLVCFLVLQ